MSINDGHEVPALPSDLPFRSEYITASIKETPMRCFTLVRDTDVSGISGTGTVAAGVLWPDRTVSMRWLTHTASTSAYASIADVETIHGHQGATRIEDDEKNLSARFEIYRHQDRVSRLTTHVADGVEWPDGTATVRWRGEHPSTVFWNSVNNAFAIHNHDGLTQFKFLDERTAE